MKPLGAPLFQTVVLGLGFAGTIVVGRIGHYFHARGRPSLFDSPFERHDVDVTAAIASPRAWRIGWILLSASFLGQIAWVWIDWLLF